MSAPPPSRRAVEVAAAVHDQAPFGDFTVGAIERCQRGDGAAALGHLENRAVVVGASLRRRAVQVAAAVHDQAASGDVTVGAVERGQGGDGAASLGQLENGAVAGAVRFRYVVPYRLPLLSMTRPADGSVPLVPLNDARVVMVPLPLASSKTVPSLVGACRTRSCRTDCRCCP